MATNTSLNRLLSKLLKKNFKGVFPIHYAIKEINKMKVNNSLIVNSACASKSEDGHFFGVIKLKKKKLLKSRYSDNFCKSANHEVLYTENTKLSVSGNTQLVLLIILPNILIKRGCSTGVLRANFVVMIYLNSVLNRKLLFKKNLVYESSLRKVEIHLNIAISHHF